jgi:hypothetical protein
MMDMAQFASLATNVGFCGALLVLVYLNNERTRKADADRYDTARKVDAERYDRLVDRLATLIANNTTAMHEVASVSSQNCEQTERIDAGVIRIESKIDRVHDAIGGNHRGA